MSSGPRNPSLLSQTSSFNKSPAVGRRRISKSSSKDVVQGPVVKHKFDSSPESKSKLSWLNFKEISTPETAEKFLWDANISSEVNRVDNNTLKEVLIFSILKYKRSRPIQMRAYQLLQDLTLSTPHRPFYTPEELRQRFDTALETLQMWRSNEYVLAACFDFLASLYFRDLTQDYTDITPTLISLASVALTEHVHSRAVIRGVAALLVKLYGHASIKTLTSPQSIQILPQVISVLETSAEEKTVIYQCSSIFCTIVEKQPELLHQISLRLMSAALKVLPHHRKNVDVCSAVYSLINDVAIDDHHMKLLLVENNQEFNLLCRSVPMFQNSSMVDSVDSVLMLVKKCMNSPYAQNLGSDLDVVSVCVSDARRHQPQCKDVKDCMAHSHCGITQLHLALCSAIEDAVAVIAMNAEGADIIDVSMHHTSTAPRDTTESVCIIDADETDVRVEDDAVSAVSSPVESITDSDGDADCGFVSEAETADKTKSVDSDEHVLQSANSSVLLRGFDGSSGPCTSQGEVRESDSVSVLTVTNDMESVGRGSVTNLSNHAFEQLHSSNSSIASQRDLAASQSIPPSQKTEGKGSVSSSSQVKEGIASKGQSDATLLLIKSLQREVDEWKSKYELMKDAHDMVLEMLTNQQSTATPPPAAKAWSPIRLDSLELDPDELNAYHNGLEGIDSRYSERDDIEFEQSDYNLAAEDRQGHNGFGSSDKTPIKSDGNAKDQSGAVVQEAYSQIPREDASLITSGVRAAFDYMAQCQIRSSLKTQVALTSLNMTDASGTENKPLKLANVDTVVLKELVFIIALIFQYLRTRQAATAEKITGSGGKTRYSITRATLRRALMSRDVKLVHHSKLPLPEIDIILHLLPVQVDLYSVTFAFVACAIRRIDLKDFYDKNECTSVVNRLVRNLNAYCSANDILGWREKSISASIQGNSENAVWSVDRSMFMTQISDETRQQSMKLLSKEDPCLQAIFRIYSDIHEGIDLTALVQIARDFSIVPVLLTLEHIIAIFERACSLGTDPKMRAKLSYAQFKIVLVEIAQSCNCFGESYSTSYTAPKYIEKVATLLWFMSNSSGREKMLEKNRCATSVPPFKVNWRILVFEPLSTNATREKLKSIHKLTKKK